MSSFTKTYVYDMTEDITSVKVDGVAMTERASASDCETLPGSWFHDVANGKLYVSASTGSVFDKTVVAIAS